MCQDRGGMRLQVGPGPLVEGVDYTVDYDTGVITFHTDGLTEEGRRMRDALADLRSICEESTLGRLVKWTAEWLERIMEWRR